MHPGIDRAEPRNSRPRPWRKATTDARAFLDAAGHQPPRLLHPASNRHPACRPFLPLTRPRPPPALRLHVSLIRGAYCQSIQRKISTPAAADRQPAGTDADAHASSHPAGSSRAHGVAQVRAITAALPPGHTSSVDRPGRLPACIRRIPGLPDTLLASSGKGRRCSHRHQIQPCATGLALGKATRPHGRCSAASRRRPPTRR